MVTKIQRRKCEGPCGKNRMLSSYVSDKGRLCAVCRKATARKSARKQHLEKTYGITPEEYDALGDVCHVCGGKRPYNLAVDHDHALERLWVEAGIEKPLATRLSIRGKVCKRDNKVLRDVRDDVDLLHSFAYYLENPPARDVIIPTYAQALAMAQLLVLPAD